MHVERAIASLAVTWSLPTTPQLLSRFQLEASFLLLNRGKYALSPVESSQRCLETSASSQPMLA